MAIASGDRNISITYLLNGTIQSLKNIVPIPHEITKPKLLGRSLELQYGVLIGIIGDIKGKLIIAGQSATFGAIGEVMFGMALEGEMLASFSGELGNMIAGSLATIIVEHGVNMDITSPTIIQGDVTLTGYDKAIQLTSMFANAGDLEIYLLLD
ncbi:chemotaxis protein CheX [Bacillus niameyensis]|uniref:chemotaxis protein CheX n=1 Tax=Bacillus niameyensis TaxID=1522308 RepID=UPI000A00DA78|nr:chemotaxis protein CheX [Bacillus niameyensis]